MIENENLGFITAQNDHITVSVFPELLEADDSARELWAYCLRIENNSEEPIRLIRKEFCLTDNFGNNYYESTEGFHGQLPDLQPEEYFEYEDTTTIEGDAVALYGTCEAINTQGKKLIIKLPVVIFDSQIKSKSISTH